MAVEINGLASSEAMRPTVLSIAILQYRTTADSENTINVVSG